MKRLFTLLAALIIIKSIGFSQVIDGYFDKLEEMYSNKEYVDCLEKADKKLNRNKFAGDPELYLYKAMCYYQISQDSVLSMTSDYQDAYMDALKNLVRAKRKDKYGEYFPANDFVVKDILRAGVPVMLSFSRQGNYSKTYSLLNRLEKITDIHPVNFYKAVMDLYNYNESEGEDKLYKMMPSLKKDIAESEDQLKALYADAMIRYFDFLIEDYELDSAKSIIIKAYEIFPADTAILRRYEINIDSLRYE